MFIHESGETKEHGEDLFPRSFIFALPLPDNYVGPTQMFGLDYDGDKGLPIFQTVSDHADTDKLTEKEGWMPPGQGNNKSHIPLYMGIPQVPGSLREAIQAFVLSTAARKARGQLTKHNSMLIHVTRFVDVQRRIRDQVEKEFFKIRDRIIYGDGDRESVLDDLKKLWENDFVPKTLQIAAQDCNKLTWEEVKERLPEAVNSIVIREINGSSGDILEYSKRSQANQAFDVIAIGGDKLSRGLTLEGLTVSYFLRHSKMYDTLMQMGRWFGYRPGYVDLCRIYTTEDLQNWFRHISKAGEELRQDFNRMVLSGCTPRQFGHRVLNHPQIMVTSPTKMRYTEKRTVSFEGDLSIVTLFSRKDGIVENNFKALQRLVNSLNAPVPGSRLKRISDFKWIKVPSDQIINFLSSYQGHPSANKVRSEYLVKYIKKQNRREMLKNWTVYISQGNGEKVDITPECHAMSVIRSWSNKPGKITIDTPYRVKTIVSPSDEYTDLEGDEYGKALEKSIELWEKSDKRSKRPKEPINVGIRLVRPPERGLLCIYPVSAEIGSDCPPIKFPLIGFFISFPGDKDAVPVQYTVNEVYRRQENEGFWDE